MLLGQHTVNETEDLMKTVEFRIQATDKVFNGITKDAASADAATFLALSQDWLNFKIRWATMREKVMPSLQIKAVSQPLVSNSLITSEPEYIQVKQAINVGGQDTFTTGDLMDCILRIEKFAGMQINEKDAPMPSGFDPDIVVYKKADSTIKAAQAAASAASAALPSSSAVASAIPWWAYGAGLAVLGGVGYSFYVTGKKVKEKAERDTAYIHENMTSKVLPGYKG